MKSISKTKNTKKLKLKKLESLPCLMQDTTDGEIVIVHPDLSGTILKRGTSTYPLMFRGHREVGSRYNRIDLMRYRIFNGEVTIKS